jgi:hypothetical protein
LPAIGEAAAAAERATMSGLPQFILALWDATQAALIGLNAVPAILLCLLIGLLQPKPSHLVIKTALVVLAAVVIAALWPMVYGYTPLWPDVTQIEGQIQVAVLIVLCLALIAGLGLAKRLILSVAHTRPA